MSYQTNRLLRASCTVNSIVAISAETLTSHHRVDKYKVDTDAVCNDQEVCNFRTPNPRSVKL